MENVEEKLLPYMNFTNTQFKTADTKTILLLKVNTQFHKHLICFSVIDIVMCSINFTNINSVYIKVANC